MIIPALHAHETTRHSRELSRRIEEVVRDYQRDNPDTSLSDVRIALAQLTPGGESSVAMGRKRALAVVVGALSVGIFTMIASTGGEGFKDTSMTWRIIGVVAALAGVTIAAIRIARRS
jgi:hypothetical protein